MLNISLTRELISSEIDEKEAADISLGSAVEEELASNSMASSAKASMAASNLTSRRLLSGTTAHIDSMFEYKTMLFVSL